MRTYFYEEKDCLREGSISHKKGKYETVKSIYALYFIKGNNLDIKSYPDDGSYNVVLFYVMCEIHLNFKKVI